MQIRWQHVCLIAVLAFAVTAFLYQQTATAAAPQTAPPEAQTSPLAKISPRDGVSIPETTLAINSPTPMSQRIVHYEIDAKYDASKHIVDAAEVLTYHNLTGQALDHFPFHLYQNAFNQNPHGCVKPSSKAAATPPTTSGKISNMARKTSRVLK